MAMTSQTPGHQQEVHYITDLGQVCYERVLPSEAHYYKPPSASVCTGDSRCPLPLSAVSYPKKLWRKNDIFVHFLEDHREKDQIMKWANEWSKHCAIIFHETENIQDSDIRVKFNRGDGAWSYVGTDATLIPLESATRLPLDSATMNLGFVDRPTVLHEFGHSLGLVHEHQSPSERGFEWNREAVIKSLSGPPNYWDIDRIENNVFKKYNPDDVDPTLYDHESIMHYSFPPEWIKGDGYPKGRIEELSETDKEYIRKLYGPSRISEDEKPTPPPTITITRTSGGSGYPATVMPVPTIPERRRKPVTQLAPPRFNVIHDVPINEPHGDTYTLTSKLSGPGAELLIRFHTSKKDRSRYTILTHGDTDMIVALLGPDDYTKLIRVDDDGAGDGKNAKIVERLMPDRDYFLQIQTFHPKGGEFEFSITAW